MKYFKQYFLRILKTKYFTLRGRADQQEFWLFSAFFYAFFCALILLAFLMAVMIGLTLGDKGAIAALPLIVGVNLFIIGLLPPLFAAFIRRLHDVGKSGWWCFLALLPFGVFVLIVFAALESQPGANKYGPNPKGVDLPLAADVFV